MSIITFVGIIGKNDKPLYLRTYETEAYSEARLIELAYSASDIFQERLRQGFQSSEDYFGLLMALQDIALYGAMSNTKIKFVVAVQDTHALVNEVKMRAVLDKIHSEYTKAVLNPFHLARVDDNEPISSLKMDRAISHIVASWSKT